MKSTINLTVFFFVIFAWVLIPHYLPQGVAVALLIAICCLYWYINSKHTSSSCINLSVGHLSNVYYGCVVAAVLSATIIPVIVLLWGYVNQAVTIIVCLISIVQPILYFLFLTVASKNTSFNKKHIWLPTYIHVIPEAVSLSVLCDRFQMGCRPFLWVCFLFVILALMLIGFFSYRLELDDEKSQWIWIHCIAVAFLLTLVLNLQLDTSTGDLKQYTATSIYKRRIVCELEDGHSFSFFGCPTGIGDSGDIFEYDGWFHINYLLPFNTNTTDVTN